MNRARWSTRLAVLVFCCAALRFPTGAFGQESGPEQVPAATEALTAPPAILEGDLSPALDQAALTWIAVVAILVLTLQTRRLRSWHNLDALALALAAVLLAVRDNHGVLANDPTGQTVQAWAYLLLSVLGLYWLVRGVRLLLARSAPSLRVNVSEGAMVVLIIAGLFVAGSTILSAPLSSGSRDGLIGGICAAETGKLPYGDTPGHDARSPLLYLLHAGAAKIVPPTYGDGIAMHWEDRDQWLGDAVWNTLDPTVIRLVNAAVFVLLLAALAMIGIRQHSLALGQALVIIACVFPGVLDCLARPEIMLPTMLVAWSIAFVTVPGVGGLVSVLLMTIAGLAWPWAWLALPVMLGYYWRQGWHALGSTVGLLGGAAATLVGMTALVAPSWPRASGALAQAGLAPAYEAQLSDDGTPVIAHDQQAEAVARTFKSWAWKFLLERDELSLDSIASRLALPNGIDASSIKVRDVAVTGAARSELQRDYREALNYASNVMRTSAALRTLLEATWKPEFTRAPSRLGTWDLWAVAAPGTDARWTLIRRSGKIVVGVLALLAAFMLVRGERGRPHQLLGGLLVVSAGTLLISLEGAVANWVWLIPTAFAALAARHGAPQAQVAPRPIGNLPPYQQGPAPRITVEK